MRNFCLLFFFSLYTYLDHKSLERLRFVEKVISGNDLVTSSDVGFIQSILFVSKCFHVFPGDSKGIITFSPILCQRFPISSILSENFGVLPCDVELCQLFFGTIQPGGFVSTSGHTYGSFRGVFAGIRSK